MVYKLIEVYKIDTNISMLNNIFPFLAYQNAKVLSQVSQYATLNVMI